MLDTDLYWYEVVFCISNQQLELAEECLTALEPLSVTLQDAGEQPVWEPQPGELPTWQQTVVRVLFDNAQQPDVLLKAVQNVLCNTSAGQFAVKKIANQYWEKAWLDHFKPMQFGRRLWVYPSHIPVSDTDKVVVTLDPGLAFGTGTHPTTALCLRWLDSMDLAGKTVIDYGCGSGVLAIAALKLGAEHAYVTDIDEQALVAVAANAKVNAVDAKLTICNPGDSRLQSADIVLANILANILVELRDTLVQLNEPSGKLVLSGLLLDQVDRVCEAYKEHYDLQAPTELDEWVLIEGKKI